MALQSAPPIFRWKAAFRIMLLLIMVLSCLPDKARATDAPEEAEPGGEPVEEEILSPGEKEGDIFEQKQEAWSQYVTSTASYMDEFFDTDHYRSTSNKTYLRLRVTPRFNREGFSVDNYVDVRLQLPNTERWLLTFGGDPDDEERYGSTPLQTGEQEQSGRDESNAYVGVSTFLKQTRTRNIGTGGGIRFRNRGIVPFLSAKWVELWEFDNWDLRLTERLRYYTDTGGEWKSQLDLDWPIAHRFFARASGAITLEKDQTARNFDIYYSLFQYLTTRRALQYKISTGYTSSSARPTYLDTVSYEATYRQQWRDWFYTNLTAQLVQTDSRDWKLEPGIRFDFNFILGHTKKHAFNSQYDAKQERLRKREWERLDKRMRELNKEETD